MKLCLCIYVVFTYFPVAAPESVKPDSGRHVTGLYNLRTNGVLPKSNGNHAKDGLQGLQESPQSEESSQKTDPGNNLG